MEFYMRALVCILLLTNLLCILLPMQGNLLTNLLFNVFSHSETINISLSFKSLFNLIL